MLKKLSIGLRIVKRRVVGCCELVVVSGFCSFVAGVAEVSKAVVLGISKVVSRLRGVAPQVIRSQRF